MILEQCRLVTQFSNMSNRYHLLKKDTCWSIECENNNSTIEIKMSGSDHSLRISSLITSWLLLKN